MPGPIRPAVVRRLSSFIELISSNASSRNSPAASRHSSTDLLSPYETNYHPNITSAGEDRLEESRHALPDDVESAAEYERQYPLLDLSMFDIREEDHAWFHAIDFAVRNIMNGRKHDASDDYQRARRVVENGKHILARESKHHQWARDVDQLVVYLGCLVHGVADRKHKSPNEMRDGWTIVESFLEQHECPLSILREVSYLVSHMSFTLEIQQPEFIASLADEHPAFRIIQDASRLDDLGTIGVARMLIYRGVDEKMRRESLDSDVALVEGRFSQYQGLMKTETGKQIAEKRYKWMVNVWMPQFLKETVTWSV